MCRKYTNMASGRGSDGREGGREGQDKGKGTFFFQKSRYRRGAGLEGLQSNLFILDDCERGWDEREKSRGGNDETRRRMGQRLVCGEGAINTMRGFPYKNPLTNIQCTEETKTDKQMTSIACFVLVGEACSSKTEYGPRDKHTTSHPFE